MKRNITRCAVIAVLMILAAAGSLTAQEKEGNYADFKAVMQEMLDATYTYIDEMNAAQSATGVASAIEKFALAMEELEPRMEAMDEKYPDISDTEFPEELAETMEEYSEMMVSMEAAMMKMFEYMTDPEVQEAMQLMQ